MSATMKKLVAPFFVIVIAIAASVGAYNANHKPAATPAPSAAVTASPQATDITYAGKDGQDALTLLQASHQVDLKQYSFGPMVTGIDGLAGTGSMTWSFYVNGTMASVGAKDYVSKAGDTLEWRYEAIQQ